jgi:PAS domain S-box-containing protein
MSEQEKIFEYLAIIAPILPAPIYWLNKNNILLGANEAAAKMIGVRSINDIVGKTAYDVYPLEMAEHIIQHDKEVMCNRKTMSQEEVIKSVVDGSIGYVISIKSPLYNDNDEVIGIVGTSIDITDKKELRNVKLENEKYKLKIKENEKILNFIENMQQNLQSFKIEMLNNKIGKQSNLYKYDHKIKLTKREREILYFLSLNKSPKEIASILSSFENKALSPLTISSIIQKQLYIKFNVNNVSKLVEVTNNLKLIPFLIN